MSKRIALVHAVHPAMQPTADAFRAYWPEADCANVLDDSLSRDRTKSHDISANIFKRFDALGDYATEIGADGVLFTCSAFGKAIEAVAAKKAFPVLKPNEAMFEAALQKGRKIGMLATFESSVASMEDEFKEMAKEKSVAATIRTICVPEARHALDKNDVKKHDELLAAAAPQLAECDVILLAHFSTSSAEKAVKQVVSVPVLTAPGAAVQKLRSLLVG